MTDTASNELELVKKFLKAYKIEEALQHVKNIQNRNKLAPEESLKALYYKSLINFYLGNFKKTYQIAEELYQRSQDMEIPIFSLDALFCKELALHGQGRLEEMDEIIEQHAKLFKSIQRENSPEFQEREALLLFYKGIGNFYNGNLDLALEQYEKSIKLFERIDPHTQTIIEILIAIADAYKEKGELNIALEYDEKALSLIPEGENFVIGLCKSIITQTIGDIYFQKGDLNNAFKYHSRVLENHRKYDFRGMMHVPYLKIISVILTQKNIAKARNYLEQFKQFKEIFQSKLSDSSYQLAYALILKTSPRMRDRVEAENILRKILKEYPNHSGALIALCELYFKEFRQSNQMEVLDDIQPLIEQLNGTAKRANSYSLLAEIKLFQAKLTLIKLNLDDARKLLTEAQQIADDHGLQLLAGAISREHDRLLEELKLWESIKKTQVSVAERLKLASIDTVLERMQGKQAIEPPELVTEEPILLLIMDQSGIPYFNHSFGSDWDIDGIFSSFMSAFNTFSSELFENSIDRIKIGENTILINPVEPFLACYVIKGQSYPAQQKLTRFSDIIKTTSEIWDALTKSLNTGEMLQLDDPPSLGSCVNEIFAI